MKSTKLIAMLALTGALITTGNLTAAEKGERGKRPEGAAKGQKGQRGGDMAKALEEIGVSKEKLQTIQKEMAALRDASPDERREKFQEILKNNLTKEQLEAFAKKRREMTGGKGGAKGGKGRPEKN